MSRKKIMPFVIILVYGFSMLGTMYASSQSMKEGEVEVVTVGQITETTQAPTKIPTTVAETTVEETSTIEETTVEVTTKEPETEKVTKASKKKKTKKKEITTKAYEPATQRSYVPNSNTKKSTPSSQSQNKADKNTKKSPSKPKKKDDIEIYEYIN